MFWLKQHFVMRLNFKGWMLFLPFLIGCTNASLIRGDFSYDLRNQQNKVEIYLPPAPQTPRFKYVGELVGQPNFTPKSPKTETFMEKSVYVLKLIAGLDTSVQKKMLYRPTHGVTEPNGRVYIVDAGLSALMVFEPNALDEDGKPLGMGELLTWKELDQNTTITKPISVALTWDETLIVTDTHLGVALHLDRSGKLLGKIGKGQLLRPTGAAFDKQRGLLYISDTPTHTIKVFDRTGTLVNTLGEPGEKPGQFNAPTQLSYSNGHLYVSDTLNSRVQIFDEQGRFVKVLGERGLNVGNLVRPKGVASDTNDLIYMVESYYAHLLVYDQQGNFLLDIKGNGVAGDNFMLPSGVWTYGKKHVYVADMLNARVVVFEFLGNLAN